MVEIHALSDRERIDWLRLSRSENVGPVTFMALLERYGGVAEALARGGGRKRNIKLFSASAAEREIAELAKIGRRLPTRRR